MLMFSPSYVCRCVQICAPESEHYNLLVHNKIDSNITDLLDLPARALLGSTTTRPSVCLLNGLAYQCCLFLRV